MIDVPQNAWVLYCFNKDEGDESLLAFLRDVANEIFLKYSKEGSSYSSHVGIQNNP